MEEEIGAGEDAGNGQYPPWQGMLAKGKAPGKVGQQKKYNKYRTKGPQMCKWVDPDEGAYVCCSFSGDWLTSAPGLASLSHTFKEKPLCGFSIFKRKP